MSEVSKHWVQLATAATMLLQLETIECATLLRDDADAFAVGRSLGLVYRIAHELVDAGAQPAYVRTMIDTAMQVRILTDIAMQVGP